MFMSCRLLKGMGVDKGDPIDHMGMGKKRDTYHVRDKQYR